MSRSSLWSLIGLTLVIPAGFEFRGASCPAQESFAETVEAVPVDELLIHPSIPISGQDLSLEVDAWWLDQSLQSLRADATTLPVTLESLLVRAVTHSSQIKVFSDLPLIRRTAITEAAKLKSTEVLAFIADEAIQIHGGMGLMSDLPLERIWRDARVERIWEGTSEIQRHIISRALLRPLGG